MYDDRSLFIGMDVGSTTVKAVVVNPKTDEILWRDYQRHETKQPEVTIEISAGGALEEAGRHYCVVGGPGNLKPICPSPNNRFWTPCGPSSTPT